MFFVLFINRPTSKHITCLLFTPYGLQFNDCTLKSFLLGFVVKILGERQFLRMPFNCGLSLVPIILLEDCLFIAYNCQQFKSIYNQMTPEQRNIQLTKLIDFLNTNNHHNYNKINNDIKEIDINESRIPKLESVKQLMHYHQDVTGTITSTFRQVSDIMIHMKQLKNRKANVQKIIDCSTAMLQIKKISYGLGKDPKQIYNNLEIYYSIKDKVYFVDKYIQKIESQISEVEKQYEATFDSQMGKNNSNSIAQLSKVLQIIRKHTHKESKPDTLQQIIQFCTNNAKKQFKKIEDELFAIPIVGNTESNYQFFDMAKTAMKVVVTLSANCKNNVVKVSGQQGLVLVLKRLFQVTAGGIILQLLMRLKKYYEIDKILVNQNKLTLREKEVKRLQPYFKEFVAIWNQLERLRIHLLADLTQACPKKNQLKAEFENIINSSNFVEINANAIQFMQSMLRFKFDKLLKNSPFVNAICTLDSDFFKEVTIKNIGHNPQAQDFLQETMNRITETIEKALQTLNTLIISAIINFINHSLIYEDVFFSFNQMFTRTFSKMPTNDPKVQNAVILVLNSLHAFPRALKTLLHLNLPQEIPSARIKAQLQEVINNNEERANKILQSLILKIVSSEWFRFELSKDYEKIVQKWNALDQQCVSKFVQEVSKVHAEIIRQTEFSKKYTQVAAINFEKEIRSIVNFYQKYSHSIIPNFACVMDYIKILLLEDEQDFKKISAKLAEVYPQAELKRIWGLRV